MAGEEVVISRSGVPVARLVPYGAGGEARRPGALRGRIRLAPDFDELPEELAQSFRGERQ